MIAIPDFRTAYVPPGKLPPAPKRVIPPMPSIEATLAAMKSDAAKWKTRKATAWGEILAVGDEALCRKPRTHWTVEQPGNLEADVLRILSRNPPMSKTYLETLIRVPCNRHKLAEVLAKMRAEGVVKYQQMGATEKHWSLA